MYNQGGDIKRILFVDLDGSLILNDSFIYSVKKLFFRNPFIAIYAFVRFWPVGRAAVKDYISTLILPELSELKLDINVYEFLIMQKKKGRRLVLATGANFRIAQQITQELNFFDAFIASDYSINMTGLNKLEAIERFSSGAPFDYLGDSVIDLPIFEKADCAYLVYRKRKIAERFKYISFTFVGTK